MWVGGRSGYPPDFEWRANKFFIVVSDFGEKVFIVFCFGACKGGRGKLSRVS